MTKKTTKSVGKRTGIGPARDHAVLADLVALKAMTVPELREKWAAIFDAPALNTSRQNLELRLGYRIQELALGGIGRDTRRSLDALAAEVASGEPGQVMTDPRRPLPGTRLVREWNGVEHTVTVLAKGFEWQGRRYKSLSGAAPFRKQAWATLIRHKITAQAEALERVNEPSERLRRLATAVRSGDPDNREAQAAHAYWPLMMDKAFRRDREASGANALLNYGYAVLRAATARAIVSTGLHPSLSVHHRSGGDALALADDLMEPFRPTVDLIVRGLCAEGITEIAEARGALVASLGADFPTPQGASPLSQVLVRLVQSLAQSCESGKLRLVFPDRPIPIAAEEQDDE